MMVMTGDPIHRNLLDSLFVPSETTGRTGSSLAEAETTAPDKISNKIPDRDTARSSQFQVSQGGTKTPGILEEVAGSRGRPVGSVCPQGGILSRV